MGTWTIDTKSRPGVLSVAFIGTFTEVEMARAVLEHNRAVDSFGLTKYTVLVDLRELKPLSQDCTKRMEEMKRYSRERKNFRGSAVWVNSTLIKLQHQRTSASGGIATTELITDDLKEALDYLRNQLTLNTMGTPR